MPLIISSGLQAEIGVRERCEVELRTALVRCTAPLKEERSPTVLHELNGKWFPALWHRGPFSRSGSSRTGERFEPG